MNGFRFGEWIVEPDLGRMRSGDQKVHLEPKALAVLECLLATPGEVISKDVLLDIVWNGRVVEPSAVPRNIATLRRALGDDSHQPRYIETIPKHGYRAIAPVQTITSEPSRNKPDHDALDALPSAAPTENLTAHTHYVNALAAMSGSLDFGLAHTELDKAIELDPGFALAISMKAYLTSVIIDPIGPDRPTTASAARHLAGDAQQLAERALALNDNLALAYVALAHVDTYLRRWTTRHAHVVEAYRLDPASPQTLFAFGMRCYELEKNDEANRLFAQAMEQDPTNPAVPGFAALRAFWAQEWAELAMLAERVVEMAPEVGQGYAMLAVAHAYGGCSEDARTTAREAATLLHSSADLREAARVGAHGPMFLMHVWRKLGEHERADELLRRLADIDEKHPFNSGEWMMAHLACGNAEQALAYMERTIRDSFPVGRVRDLKYYPEHPIFDPVREDVRFELARREVEIERVG